MNRYEEYADLKKMARDRQRYWSHPLPDSRELTKSELREQLAQAVRNTAALQAQSREAKR